MGLTILSQASLPLTFWDHSFTQVVYLINKLPTSALTQFKSPHHALFKSQPDYTQIKVFGCLCFPHLRSYNKHKLQYRSSPCVYLGASPQHKGHKCLDEQGSIYISKDVIYHESQFPYTSMFPDSSLNTDNSSSSTFHFILSQHMPQLDSYVLYAITNTKSDPPSTTSTDQSLTNVSLPQPNTISHHNDHSMITRARLAN
jgi:histone deacetylase 1/2